MHAPTIGHRGGGGRGRLPTHGVHICLVNYVCTHACPHHSPQGGGYLWGEGGAGEAWRICILFLYFAMDVSPPIPQAGRGSMSSRGLLTTHTLWGGPGRAASYICKFTPIYTYKYIRIQPIIKENSKWRIYTASHSKAGVHYTMTGAQLFSLLLAALQLTPLYWHLFSKLAPSDAESSQYYTSQRPFLNFIWPFPMSSFHILFAASCLDSQFAF